MLVDRSNVSWSIISIFSGMIHCDVKARTYEKVHVRRLTLAKMVGRKKIAVKFIIVGKSLTESSFLLGVIYGRNKYQ